MFAIGGTEKTENTGKNILPGLHRLEKYFNLKFLKIIFAFRSAGKYLKSLE